MLLLAFNTLLCTIVVFLDQENLCFKFAAAHAATAATAARVMCAGYNAPFVVHKQARAASEATLEHILCVMMCVKEDVCQMCRKV